MKIKDIVSEDIETILNDIKSFTKVLNNKRILVVGGKGFLGTYFVRILNVLNQFFDNSLEIKKVVSFSIPFIQQALKGEKIKACGLLEEVTPKSGEKYYRIVVGYFDAYISERREKEFIKAEI